MLCWPKPAHRLRNAPVSRSQRFGGPLSRIFGAAVLFFSLLLPSCLIAPAQGGEVRSRGRTGAQCLGPADLPNWLQIENDDADWLCGDRRPERPREYDIGVVAAGIEECYPGDEPPVSGEHIWISPQGDDTNSGESPASALRTLKSVLCRVAPGQTVHLLPGVYREAVALGGAGNADSATIRIRGEGADPTAVVLDGEYWRSFAIGLVESFHISIENLTVQHYTDAGIYSLGGGDVSLVGVVSRYNGRCNVDPDSEGEGFGVNLVGTGDIRVEGSRFEHNGPLLAPVLCGDVLGTGINTFEASGVIRGNTIRHTRGGGILVEKSTGPFLVEDNVVEKNDLLAPDNYWDGGIWIDESVDVTVGKNRFSDNWGGAGIQISDEEGAYPRSSKQITVTGNTLTGNFAGVLIWGYGVCPPPGDVITNWESLLQDNRVAENRFDGKDYPIRCDPEFVGGEVPAPRVGRGFLHLPWIRFAAD
ncbi:MAG: right-handed parallel beta-helix repeat-containing protein [Caldilineae bacterium]|nr:MAG: right-handed parallel beta-helix repeat-containing protein [Caldilineae bacterium]